VYIYHTKGLNTVTDDIEDILTQKDLKEMIELKNFLDCVISNMKKFKVDLIDNEGRENFNDLLDFLYGKDHELEKFKVFKSKQFSKKLESTQFQPEDDKHNDRIIERIWREFFKQLSNSSIVEEEIRFEKQILAKALVQVDDMIPKGSEVRDIINKEEVVKRFISYVIENDYDENNKQTILLILDALGNIIENEEDEDEKVEKQNFLNRANATSMIFIKLCDRHVQPKDQLFSRLIQLCIKMLEGGNREVQKSVCKYFTSSVDSEIFFVRIHEKISNEIASLKEI